MLKRLAITFVIGAQLAVSTATAAIPNYHRIPQIRYLTLAPHNFEKGLDVSVIQPIESLRTIKSEDVAMMIPHRDLTTGADGSLVATRILDHSLSNFFNSPAVRNSDFGKTAHTVEKSMESEAAFGGSEEGSVQHKLKFAMKAIETKAQLEYSGVTNAQLSYNIAQSKMDLEVHEQVASNTRVVFNHIDQPDDRRETLSLRWAW